jgi:uncharacterized protein (TIGR03437 family)
MVSTSRVSTVRCAALSILLIASLPGAIQASTCNVDLTKVGQRIDGFGGSTAWYISLAHDAPPAMSRQILDALFSPTLGAGLTIVRNRIPPAIEPSENVWNWTQDGDAVWAMTQARTYGVNRFISSPWTPPGWMKQVNDPNAWVELQTGKWQDFATYLAQYVLQYKALFGLDIYGISLGNEPDWNAQTYECSQWDATSMHDFILSTLIPTWQSAGVTAKLTAPEEFKFAEDLIVPSLTDPATRDRVDIVAAHAYYDPGGNLTTSIQYGKPIWITEDSSSGTADDPSIASGVQWTQTIAGYLASRHVSAFNYWWLVGPSGSGPAALITQQSGYTFTFDKRLYTLGNFSRFVRPGYFSAQADFFPSAGVSVAAFVNNGNMVLVAVNSGTADVSQAFSVTGFAGASVTPWRTSATENLGQLSDIVVSGGQFTATLAAQSVTTFVGQAVPFHFREAAGYSEGSLANAEWVALFSSNLATSTQVAPGPTFPTSLGGTQVTVTDSAGTQALAPLLFVSPGQVNFLMPDGLAVGPASITVANSTGSAITGLLNLATVEPGLFSANQNGQGAAAGWFVTAASGNSQTFTPVAQCGTTSGSCAAAPFDLANAGGTVVLELFGTGLRGVSALSAATCTIGGVNASVSFVGAQGQYVGLDQVNVTVPGSLKGAGEVPVVLTLDGHTANTVTVSFK